MVFFYSFSLRRKKLISNSGRTIPTLTNDEYKMGRQTNDKVEVNVEVNSVETSDDSTIAKEQYLPPPPHPQVLQLKKAKVK